MLKIIILKLIRILGIMVSASNRMLLSWKIIATQTQCNKLKQMPTEVNQN